MRGAAPVFDSAGRRPLPLFAEGQAIHVAHYNTRRTGSWPL